MTSHTVLASLKVYFVRIDNEEMKKGPGRGCLHTMYRSAYKNCVESSLISRANVMAIRSLKFKKYNVKVRKIPC